MNWELYGVIVQGDDAYYSDNKLTFLEDDKIITFNTNGLVLDVNFGNKYDRNGIINIFNFFINILNEHFRKSLKLYDNEITMNQYQLSHISDHGLFMDQDIFINKDSIKTYILNVVNELIKIFNTYEKSHFNLLKKLIRKYLIFCPICIKPHYYKTNYLFYCNSPACHSFPIKIENIEYRHSKLILMCYNHIISTSKKEQLLGEDIKKVTNFNSYLNKDQTNNLLLLILKKSKYHLTELDIKEKVKLKLDIPSNEKIISLNNSNHFLDNDKYDFFFHGTEFQNLISILKYGISSMSPDKFERSKYYRNGSVHGHGIYGSKSFNTAMNYTNRESKEKCIFICAYHKQYSGYTNHDWCLTCKNDKYVYPIGLII